MPPLPQAPGFPPPCVAPSWCSLDGWVVMGGLMADALIVTTILLYLALFISLIGQRKSWREYAPLLLVGLCALIAVLCAVRLLQLNLPDYVGNLHYTPAEATRLIQLGPKQFALMAGPLSVLAFVYAGGVSVAIATLVRRLVRA